MKHYLLIPIEEISDELNRLNNKTVYSHEQEVYESSFIKYLEKLQSKEEIVEIKNNKLTDLFKEYSHSKTKQTFESFVVNEQGYKLIKTIKQ